MRWHQDIGRHPVETVYLAAILTCLTILLLRMAAQWWRARRLAGGGHARCATCGYILIPGSSIICPECGSDVGDHGLLTRTAPLRTIALGPAYVLIALLSLPIAALASDALRGWHPFGWTYHANVMITLPHDSGTGIAAHWCVQTDGTGRYFGRRPRHLMIYRNDGGDPESVTLVVRPADFVLTFRGGRSSSERVDRPLDLELVAAFVRQTTAETTYPNRRVTLDDATIARLSQEILSAARLLAAGDVPSDQWPRATVNYNLSDWAQLVSLLLTAAVISTAGVYALRRAARTVLHRKRQRWRQEAARLGLVEGALR